MSLTTEQTIEKIVKALDSKKAIDIKAIKIGELTSIGDYFIIASGSSTSQTKALSDEVEEVLSKLGVEPKRIEGYQSAQWILLDYYDVIVHIFQKDSREFYNIERLYNI